MAFGHRHRWVLVSPIVSTGKIWDALRETRPPIKLRVNPCLFWRRIVVPDMPDPPVVTEGFGEVV